MDKLIQSLVKELTIPDKPELSTVAYSNLDSALLKTTLDRASKEVMTTEEINEILGKIQYALQVKQKNTQIIQILLKAAELIALP